jgi:MFS transporter, DHA1 family, inner membrane transport protein
LNKKEVILVGLLALLNFTIVLDLMIMMPLGNLLMPKWNLSTSEFAIIVSSYSLSAFVSSFFAIFFADNFDRKKLLLFAYSFFLIGTFACSFAIDKYTMIFARSLTGIFGGLIGASILSIVSEVIPYERRGQALGLLISGFALASIIGVPLGLYLANNYYWYFPFLIVAIFGTLLLPFLIKFVPNLTVHLENPTLLKQRIVNLSNVFKSSHQTTALLFSFLLIMGHFLIIPLINPYLVFNVGVPQKYTPLIYLVGGIGALITGQIVGKVADKFGKRQVFVIAATVSLIFILLITNMPVIRLSFVLIIFCLWFSSSTGRTIPGQAMITQTVSNTTRGSFLSLNSCFQSLATGSASLLSGGITYCDASFAIHNYNVLGYISVCLIIICVLLSFRLEKFLINT